MSLSEVPKNPTYRLSLNDTTIVGETIEIQNPAGSGKNLVFTQCLVTLNTASDIRLSIMNPTNTVGTSSAKTVYKKRTASPTSVVTTAKTYSVAPTPGTITSDLGRFTIPTNGTIQLQQDRLDAESIPVAPGEALSIFTSVITTAKGMIEWMEIPL